VQGRPRTIVEANEEEFSMTRSHGRPNKLSPQKGKQNKQIKLIYCVLGIIAARDTAANCHKPANVTPGRARIAKRLSESSETPSFGTDSGAS
jgi:hypothetical protein